MYFILGTDTPGGAERARLTYRRDHPRRSWNSGQRFSTNPNDPPHRRTPPEPVRVEIEPGHAGVMLDFFPVPVPLMTRRLMDALQGVGVTNLDCYKAEIRDSETNQVWNDYVAVNIIGAIAAADLKHSRFDPTVEERAVSMDFNSLVIDEGKTQGALLFRLAESVNAIVVHERVKQALEKQAFNTLRFFKPEDWAG